MSFKLDSWAIGCETDFAELWLFSGGSRWCLLLQLPPPASRKGDRGCELVCTENILPPSNFLSSHLRGRPWRRRGCWCCRRLGVTGCWRVVRRLFTFSWLALHGCCAPPSETLESRLTGDCRCCRGCGRGGGGCEYVTRAPALKDTGWGEINPDLMVFPRATPSSRIWRAPSGISVPLGISNTINSGTKKSISSWIGQSAADSSYPPDYLRIGRSKKKLRQTVTIIAKKTPLDTRLDLSF